MRATLHTTKGDIEIALHEHEAPGTVANFKKLAESGFYDGVKFHRVIQGFMIQSGDPLTKDDSQSALWGAGGPGYTVPDEIHEQNFNVRGTISTANTGRPDTNGSQFFINSANNNFLDTKHTVFGAVVSGMEVVDAIEATPVREERPVEPIVINSVTIV